MANPTNINNEQPALVEATITQSSIDLDQYRAYTINHTGKSTAGTDATGAIVFAYQKPGESAPTITADYSAESNKCILGAAVSVVVPPECDVLHFKSASGSPVFQVVPAMV